MSASKMPVLLAASVAALCLSTTGYAQQPQQIKTGMFSSMYASEQTGDIHGTELFVVPGANGYVVIAQGTEGAPGTPVVLPLTLLGNADVEFDVPASCPCALLEGRYRARLMDDGLILSRQGSQRESFLPRGDSFWQAFWRQN